MWTKVNGVLEEEYAFFLNDDQSFAPKKTVSVDIHRNPASWWDEDCQEVLKDREAAFLMILMELDDIEKLSDHIVYNRIDADAQRTLKTKKKAKFRKFAQSLNMKADLSMCGIRPKL
ncbi:hypothetical protein QAD02_001390 [Eretmocerus hayati]|uniref:Uncharacterized protein n=1 Tax=Eretmocerus hayati TaxID=131215 RepID=A0ACC2NGD0_9HYME|nr:hypothetical protein QAD02_001390 [Eretmocerus hayati]